MPSVAPYQPLRPSRSETLAIRHQRYHVRLWGNAAPTQPPLVMVSVIGLAMLPFATRTLWGRLPLADRVTDEDIGQHVAALLLHGIGAFGGAPDDVGKTAKRKTKPRS